MKSGRETSANVPYYKLNKLYEQYSVPSFINRRTLAGHVRDNQLVFGRRSYFQRIIYLARHRTVIEPHKIKDPFNKIIKEIYKYPMDDGRLGGLLIGHDMYSVHMLEGSDELIGNYFQHLSKISDELFDKSRVVLVYNNINQRFFEKIVWRLANLPDITDVSENMERNISTVLKKIYYLCKKIKEEEADEDTAFKSYYLASELEEWTPDEKLMEAVLDVEGLQTIKEFADIYGNCASMLTFEDRHWPVEDDHLPTSSTSGGKYDVNLIFGRDGTMKK